ncbi:unnamed protein product [Phytophthora fragariaefolia]|uniref:Unnamed protein product n=1 Tax=Phytophthora fragariaefolia TaxID=1490495 RepID=A0A9W7CRC2_9STRA|nr:unnamed protein product [Phytophthora fragariaefolia]
MRSSYFLALLLIVCAACVTGVTINDVANQAILNGGNAHRNLKGSATLDAATEERLPAFITKIASFFKGSSAVPKVLNKNPSVAKVLEKNPSIAKNVEAMGKDAELLKSLKKSPSFDALRNAIKSNPKAVSTEKVEELGSFLTRIKKIELVGDVKGMVIAYGILFLAVIGIIGVGIAISNNVRNSYIH